MAAPRRGTLWFLLACLALLVASEYVMITVFVLPAPSERIDWILATVFIAPMVTLGIMFAVGLAARTVDTALSPLRYIGRCITKSRRQHRNVTVVPSSGTTSAVPPSSSSTWPSVGPSYISPPGRERVTWREP